MFQYSSSEQSNVKILNVTILLEGIVMVGKRNLNVLLEIDLYQRIREVSFRTEKSLTTLAKEGLEIMLSGYEAKQDKLEEACNG